MLLLLTGLVLGALLGAAVGVLWQQRRGANAGEELSAAVSARAAAEARADEQQATILRERENHAQALANLSDRFKNLASETLEQVVAKFQDGQVQAIEQRELKLDQRLDPLQALLQQYKEKVEQLEQRRETGYLKVEHAAAQLQEAQAKVLDETNKLNTILGRSSARGRWGEIQLERILEISGMNKHVTFNPQYSMMGSSESRQRPDVVVHLPNDAQIAIDAKVPYDGFDRAMATDDPEERDAELKSYATALRQHVQSLKKKEYSAGLDVSPAFVICFVPSDHLLSAAYEADQKLFVDSLELHVLVAGPTTLLGLLWATSLGWSQFEAQKNVDEIQILAERLISRAATLFEHVDKLGKSIESSAKNYGSMVGSLEGNLFATMREMQRKGVGGVKEELGVITRVPETPRLLDPKRWIPSGDDDEAIDAQIIEPAIELAAVSGEEPIS